VLTVNLIPVCSISGTHNGMQRMKIVVTGYEGPYGCESSSLPHFRDTQLTDGSEVVSLKLQLTFTARKIPGTHFC
jgi:hypothetical protein